MMTVGGHAMSPTERTLRECRRMGWTCAVVEKWNPHARIRQDLFGMFDVLALTPDGIVGIQCTTAAHMAERARKLADNAILTTWLEHAGAEVWGWLLRPRGRRKWELRRRRITPYENSAANDDPAGGD